MTETSEFWNKIAKKYAKSPIKNVEAYRLTMDRTKFHLSMDDEVLEIGCGTGSTALLLADSVKTILASDVSAEMIEIAKNKSRDGQVANVEFVQATLADDILRPESYDAVLAFSLLHLLADTSNAIRGIRQRLKPGGLFISKTPCLAETGWHFRLLIPVMQALGRAPFVRFFKIAELEQAIAAEGFEIAEACVFPGAPRNRFIVARKI